MQYVQSIYKNMYTGIHNTAYFIQKRATLLPVHIAWIIYSNKAKNKMKINAKRAYKNVKALKYAKCIITTCKVKVKRNQGP